MARLSGSVRRTKERELGTLNLGELKVFYVGGTDHAKKCQLYGGLKGHGVVVVPREGEEGETAGEENTTKDVYFAKPSTESGISSTAVRQALSHKNYELVKKKMSADASNLLLRPTEEQRATFAADFARLAAMTSGKRKQILICR